MATWVLETQPPDSEFRKAVDTVTALTGPVGDLEAVLTDLDLGRKVFGVLTEDDRDRACGRIRRCLGAFFKGISKNRGQALLHEAFAKEVEKGDVVVTFNYDVALESELIRAQRFRVRNGYGSSLRADWDEADSDVIVLKPHGSINWIGRLFGGARSGYFGKAQDSLGQRPFVDNVDSVLPGYPDRVLDREFKGGGVTDESTTIVLPTYEKRFSVKTSLGDEWLGFFESLWSQAADSLQQADRIIIVGYSLPEADRRSRALLLWTTNKRAEVIICCSTSNAAIRAQFEGHGFWRVREAGTFADFLGVSAR
jgi:aspartate 1-decarboxylase